MVHGIKHLAPALALAVILTPLTAQEAATSETSETSETAQVSQAPLAAAGPLALFTWADFDADGLMDAFVIQPDGSGHLLHNRGDGSFEEQTERRGLLEALFLSDAAWADYDGDGLVDLLWASPAGALLLWKQSQKGTFVDETHLAGLGHVEGGIEVEWRDLNADGLADLRVSTVARERVFQNTVGGSFVEVDLSLDPRVPFAGGAWLIADPRESERVRPDPGAVTRRAGELSDPRGGSPVGIGDRTADGGSQSFTGGSVIAGGSASSMPPTPGCSGGIDDLAAPGICIQASSIPTLGALYPMSSLLSVDPVTGWVGVNKIDPDTRLHVVGQGRFVGGSDVSTNPGTGMLQVLATNALSGLGLDTNEIQTWGADLHINEDNQFGTSINSTVYVTTAGSVGINRVPDPSMDLDVEGVVRAGDTIVSAKVFGAPFQITSTDVSANLNADRLDGFDASATPAIGSLYPLSVDFNVDASGHIGLGTTAPTAALHLSSSDVGGTSIVVETQNTGSSGDAGLDLRAEGGERYVVGWDESLDVFRIYSGTQGANVLNIDDSTGNVGIRTTSPGYPLEVIGTIDTDGLRMTTGAQAGRVLTSDATGTATWQVPSGGGGGDSDWVISGNDMYSGVSGKVGIGSSTPSARLHLVPPLTLPASAALLIEAPPSGLSTSAFMGFKAASGLPGYRLGHFLNQAFALYSEALGTNVLTVKDATGFVGIGSTDPDTRLHIEGGSDVGPAGGGFLQLGDAAGNIGIDNNEIMARDSGGASTLNLNLEGGNVVLGGSGSVGRVGLGVSNPQHRLHVLDDAPGSFAAFVENTSTSNGMGMFVRNHSDWTSLVVETAGGGNLMDAWSGPTRVFSVTNTGRVVTTALEITGGGDLVEAFDSREGGVEPGSVMIIDSQNAGGLTLSSDVYDTKVAGIVSGAGGVQHGIQLTQAGVLEGDTLLAMTGRVWCKCSAENGAIQPGDRLTTASLLGHAMRASDELRSPGAVIGKAMTALDEGTGLVLVLVNLQ